MPINVARIIRRLARPTRATGKYRRALLAASLILACAVSSAQTISGVGGRDCQAFNVALAKDSQVALDSYVAWSQGFISGFNWSNPQQFDIRIDAAAIISWLGPYCEGHPEDRIYLALQQLIHLNAR